MYVIANISGENCSTLLFLSRPNQTSLCNVCIAKGGLINAYKSTKRKKNTYPPPLLIDLLLKEPILLKYSCIYQVGIIISIMHLGVRQ